MATGALLTANVTADGAATAGKGDFYGVTLDAGSVILYDSASAAGTKIMTVAAPGMMMATGTWVPFVTGIFVDLTTAANVTVYFSK